MKKLTLFITMILCSALIGGNIQASNVDNDKVKIVITDKTITPLPETQKPRDVIQPKVEASLCCNSGNIVFTFNVNIGVVVISVSDVNGNVVASTICNSNQSSTATISAPMISGEYTIDIVGAQYMGVGTFEL